MFSASGKEAPTMLKLLMVAIGMLLIVGPAQATPTLIIDSGSGQWLGAAGVTVNGAEYNLTFAAGTCAAVFGACDQEHFAFTTLFDASLAQFAIDAMAHDGGFENNPQLIDPAAGGLPFPTAAIMTP